MSTPLIIDPDHGPQAPAVFEEPWQAQAFAMVVHLHAQGVFSWQDWADRLSAEIHSGIERPYYDHWLHALEAIVTGHAGVTAQDLDQRRQDWHAAAARTPHGEPILL